mmetsp:Transcript_51567/g.121005  ORF Transcript_51567/g.121005 Transcript_51567/m.121005 type:complete len:195 (-) Transcript_51567:79-663(-)
MEKEADPEANDADIKEMFSDEDPNGDGEITQAEWEETFSKAIGEAGDEHLHDGKENPSHEHTEEELKEHRQEFDDIDKNKNGFLDEDEIKDAWTHQDGKFDPSWKEQDTDGDGKLTFEEFIMVPPTDPELAKLWQELENDEEEMQLDEGVDVDDGDDGEDAEGLDAENPDLDNMLDDHIKELDTDVEEETGDNK